jgi:hypothetical protein
VEAGPVLSARGSPAVRQHQRGCLPAAPGNRASRRRGQCAAITPGDQEYSPCRARAYAISLVTGTPGCLPHKGAHFPRYDRRRRTTGALSGMMRYYL